MTNTINETLEFYKSIFVYLRNQVSLKEILLELASTIILLIIINNFQQQAEDFTITRQTILNILLIIPFILLLIKAIKTIYQYKFKIFATEEERISTKQNNIFHLKKMIYGTIGIWLGWFIISFVFASVGQIIGNTTNQIESFRASFVSIILFSIIIIKGNLIVSFHLFNKEKRIYRLNYLLLPIIVVIGSYIYLSVNS